MSQLTTLKDMKLDSGKTHTAWKKMKNALVKGLDKDDKKQVETFYKTLDSGLSKLLKKVEGSKDPDKFVAAANNALKTLAKYKSKVRNAGADLPGKSGLALDGCIHLIQSDLKQAVALIRKNQ